MSSEPPVGTIGVVSTAHAASLLTRFTSWVIRFDTESPVNHAFVYVGKGQILEARPRGSGFSRWDFYPGTIWLASIKPPDKPAVVQAAEALKLCGIPYNWLDLVAIGIAQRRWSPELQQQWDAGHEPWWVKRVSDDGRLICSQLCDLYYRRLGRRLFNDGRLSGLVSPGDLLALNQSLAGGLT